MMYLPLQVNTALELLMASGYHSLLVVQSETTSEKTGGGVTGTS